MVLRRPEYRRYLKSRVDERKRQCLSGILAVVPDAGHSGAGLQSWKASAEAWPSLHDAMGPPGSGITRRTPESLLGARVDARAVEPAGRLHH